MVLWVGCLRTGYKYGHLEYWALGKPKEVLWVGCLGTGYKYGHLEYWALGQPKEEL